MASLQTARLKARITTVSSSHKRAWTEGVPARPAREYVLPAAAGCVMLAASVLPWLTDPLDGGFSAWRLSVDIGWQLHSSIISYGLLCACSGLLALGLVFVRWRRGPALAACLCAAPVVLFLQQYLFVDLHAMNAFAQHWREYLLIRHHFGYNVPNALIIMQPFAVTISTLQGRIELLIDQFSIGVLLPCAGACILIAYQRMCDRSAAAPLAPKRLRSTGTWLVVALLLCCAVVLGRAPAALACNYEAKLSLADGDYGGALLWLDSALALNPELGQLSFYHEERGQAWYYLYPGGRNDDSAAYLAQVYRQQGNYVDAYKELLAGWHASAPVAWMTDELSTTLEMQAEYVLAINALPVQLAPVNLPALPWLEVLLQIDSTNTFGQVPALPWLEVLLQIDNSNVYGQYLEGRMQCSLHSYSQCAAYMQNVLTLSYSAQLQSSAYTYMGLSAEGQGQYAQARQLLLKAIKLDPNYRNNIAREELSGLH
jgi:tetratricopeptide (TPR) repeat protein